MADNHFRGRDIERGMAVSADRSRISIERERIREREEIRNREIFLHHGSDAAWYFDDNDQRLMHDFVDYMEGRKSIPLILSRVTGIPTFRRRRREVEQQWAGRGYAIGRIAIDSAHPRVFLCTDGRLRSERGVGEMIPTEIVSDPTLSATRRHRNEGIRRITDGIGAISQIGDGAYQGVPAGTVPSTDFMKAVYGTWNGDAWISVGREATKHTPPDPDDAWTRGTDEQYWEKLSLQAMLESIS